MAMSSQVTTACLHPFVSFKLKAVRQHKYHIYHFYGLITQKVQMLTYFWYFCNKCLKYKSISFDLQVVDTVG